VEDVGTPFGTEAGVNVWEQFAESQIASPVKARRRAAEKRVQKKALKAAEEEQQLSRGYRKSLAEKREKLLASPYGAQAQALIDFLKGMTIESGGDLIALVEAGPWQNANADTRYEILSLIDRAIMRLRERNGLATFDDGLLTDQPNVSQTIRGVLRCD
jgi:hypothetical protein